MPDDLVRLYLMRRAVPDFRPEMRGASLKEGHMHPVPRTPFTARYPLLVRGGIALVLMGVTRLAVAVGWFPPEWQLSETGVEQLLDAVYLAWAWFTSQRKVTPVADPRDDDGRPLVVQGHVERPRPKSPPADGGAPGSGWPRLP